MSRTPPRALTVSSDSYNEELDRLRRSDRPLSLIFNEGGSLLTLEEVNNPSIPTTQCVAFKLNFKHYPLTFLKMEYKLKDRCIEVGVKYIRPKITDSVQDTVKRKATLNRAIKSAKQNSSRKAMPKEDRKKRSTKEMEYRHNKISNESEEGRLKRWKRNADYEKKRGDTKFDTHCKREYVPGPPPRKNDDTGSTTRINRKMCTDAIRDRTSAGEEKIHKEQERRRKLRGECTVYLPANAEGPGIEVTSNAFYIKHGAKHGNGRDAAAALHSMIKDDIKNGKSTTYRCYGYGDSGVSPSWKPYKQCKGVVVWNEGGCRRWNWKGDKRRCKNNVNGKGELCCGCAREDKEDRRFIESLSSTYNLPGTLLDHLKSYKEVRDNWSLYSKRPLSYPDSERLEMIEMKRMAKSL